MRKKVASIIFVIILTLFPQCLMAANQVDNINIDAFINEDGSMYFTQTWEGSFSEGTECYFPINGPEYLTVSDLTVSDQKRTYETLNNWDVSMSFAEKAGKCGLNYTENGYEICFGISQYGQNRYTISYKLDNVIGGYTDYDGVNFRFVSSGMNTTPTNVRVKIQLSDGRAISDEMADIWGFGFAGETGFDNGSLLAYSTSPLNTENHVTLLFSFAKGVLNPVRQEAGSFAEIKEAAFAGSDYDSDEDEESVLAAIVVFFLFLAIIIIFIIVTKKLKKILAAKKQKSIIDKFDYFRDIPNGGNLSVTYTLGKYFGLCEEGSILAAGILKLIQTGCLSCVESTETGFMGKTRQIISLQLMGFRHDKMDEFDEYLYTVLEVAAGSNQILENKELERFANNNDVLLRNFIEKHESVGKTWLNQKNCFKRWRNPAKLKDLTPAGEKELGQVIGLKKYLMDFSLIAEHGLKEISIWQELLILAMLFGIAEEVAEQMKELYPQLSEQLPDYSRSIAAAGLYRDTLYKNMVEAERERLQEQRSKGSGGVSSLGGGGGFIGGGSGGGTR